MVSFGERTHRKNEFHFLQKAAGFFLAGYLFFSWANLAAATSTPPPAGHAGVGGDGGKKEPRPQAPADSPTAESAPAEQKEPNLTKALETEKATEEFLKDHEAVAKALGDIDLDSQPLNYNELKTALEKAGVQDPTGEQLESLLAHYASQKALEGSEVHLAFIDKVLDGARGKESSTLSDLEKKINERGLKLRNELLNDNPKLKEALDKLSHQSQSAQGFQLQSIMEGLKKGKDTNEYKRAVTKLSQWITPLSPSSRKEIVEAASKANADSLSGVLKTAVESRVPQSPTGRLAAAAKDSGLVDLELLQEVNKAEKKRAESFQTAVLAASSFSNLEKLMKEQKIADSKGLVEWAAQRSSDSAVARKVLELKAKAEKNPSLVLRSNVVGGSSADKRSIQVFGGDAQDAAAAARELASAGSFSGMLKAAQKQIKEFNSGDVITTADTSSLEFFGEGHVRSLQYVGAQLLKSPPTSPGSSRATGSMETKFNSYLRAVKNLVGSPNLTENSLKAFFKSGDYMEGEDQEQKDYAARVEKLSSQQLFTLFNQFMADGSGKFNYCPSCWAGAGGHLNRLFLQTGSK